MARDIDKIFPSGLRKRMETVDGLEEEYTEVRFRCNCPVILQKGKREFFLHKECGITKKVSEAYRINAGEIKEMMEYISNFSIYAYEEEMRQGFLTLQGGHRVGICGKTVISGGNIKTIRNVSFLNLRLAHQKKGCAKQWVPYLFEREKLCHTLIISPPGCGKTTFLRDIIRILSDGEGLQHGYKVGVVDERSEIAACYNGIPQNEIGIRTDVLDGCPKKSGMELLLRSMSPEVMAVDEVGGVEDIEMIKKSICSGCRVIATAHGERSMVWFEKQRRQEGIQSIPFERYIFLKEGNTPGMVEKICDASGKSIWMEGEVP